MNNDCLNKIKKRLDELALYCLEEGIEDSSQFELNKKSRQLAEEFFRELESDWVPSIGASYDGHIECLWIVKIQPYKQLTIRFNPGISEKAMIYVIEQGKSDLCIITEIMSSYIDLVDVVKRYDWIKHR